MIRYSLLCKREHAFESWFRDSAAFDALSAAAQVACPQCGSTLVRKALMSPSVVTSRSKVVAVKTEAPVAADAVPESPTPQPVTLIDERMQQLRAMARELHRKITEHADDVGRAFATEARAIHDGGKPPRSIYGEATREEVTALLDDGIPLMPMPVLPDDHH